MASIFRAPDDNIVVDAFLASNHNRCGKLDAGYSPVATGGKDATLPKRRVRAGV